MIIELYVLMVIISLVAIAVGLFVPAESVYAILGFSFFFVAGIILLTGNVYVHNGSNITTTSINSTAYTLIEPISTPATDSYSQWFGRFMAIGGGLGFAACMVMLRGIKRKEENEE